MDLDEIKSLLASAVLPLVLVFSLLIGFLWWSAGQESQAYYRATGKQVSQWDALFLELRVQGN